MGCCGSPDGPLEGGKGGKGWKNRSRGKTVKFKTSDAPVRLNIGDFSFGANSGGRYAEGTLGGDIDPHVATRTDLDIKALLNCP